MKPIDYRNETWLHVRDRVVGLRKDVYQAWLKHGPGTTRDVAERAGLDLLTFRPRTTELLQLGYLTTAPEGARGHEGAYQAVPEAAALKNFLDRQAEAKGGRQLNLRLGELV